MAKKSRGKFGGKARGKPGPEPLERRRSLVSVAIEPPRQRLVASLPNPFQSGFVSQIIAERQHLPPQRQIYRASFDVAVQCYAEGAQKAVKRIPAGYRRTLTV